MMFSNQNFNKFQNILLYIFIFLLPWQTRYIFNYLTLGNKQYEYGKLSIYLSEVFLLLLFLIFFINWIIFGLKYKKISKIFLLAFLLFLIAIVSYFFAIDLKMYSYGLLRLSEAILLLFALSKINFSWTKVAIAFVSSMSIHAILGINQFFTQYIYPNKYLGIAEQISSIQGVSIIEDYSGKFLRAYGGFSHPNIFAGFLLIAILFLLAIYIKKYQNLNLGYRILFWFSLVIISNTFILTFSRSAFLAFFVSILIFAMFFIYKRLLKKVLPIIFILFLIFSLNIIIFYDLLLTRASFSERLEIKSNIERNDLQNQAIKIIKQNYISGVGLNNYIPYIYKNINSNLEIEKYQPVHSVPLLVFSELGIFGLMIYVFLFISSFLKQIYNKNELSFIFALMTIAIFIISLLDHYFWTSFSGIILFFIMLSFSNLKNFD